MEEYTFEISSKIKKTVEAETYTEAAKQVMGLIKSNLVDFRRNARLKIVK